MLRNALGGMRRSRLALWCTLLTLALLISWAAWFFSRGTDYLSISPRTFSECGGVTTKVHVSWDTGDGLPATLMVKNIGKSAKVWTGGKPKGEADTGAWMSDGTTVILKTSDGRVLHRRTLVSTVCAVPAKH